MAKYFGRWHGKMFWVEWQNFLGVGWKKYFGLMRWQKCFAAPALPNFFNPPTTAVLPWFRPVVQLFNIYVCLPSESLVCSFTLSDILIFNFDTKLPHMFPGITHLNSRNPPTQISHLKVHKSHFCHHFVLCEEIGC